MLVLSLFGEKEIKELLDKLFKEFYFKYRFIVYISKCLYFEAVNYDKRKRKDDKRQSIIIDQTIIEVENITLIDKIATPEDIEDQIFKEELEELLTDVILYRAYKNLTKKQQNILYLAFAKELKDVEIAAKINVTQQAVSKSRKNALMILKKALEVKK